MGEYLTPEQVANRLQVSKATVLRWLRGGKLSGARIGHRTWRIRPKAVEALVNEEFDREPLSARDWAEIHEGIRAIQRGDYITLDEYKRRRGL